MNVQLERFSPIPEVKKEAELKPEIAELRKEFALDVFEPIFPTSEVPKTSSQMMAQLVDTFNNPMDPERIRAVLADETGEAAEALVAQLIARIPVHARRRFLTDLSTLSGAKMDWDAFDYESTLDAITSLSTDKGTSMIDRLISLQNRILLGFHVSSNDIPTVGMQGEYLEEYGEQALITPHYTSDSFGHGQFDSSKTWYSIDPTRLYCDKSPRFVYLVEGSRADIDSERFYDKARGALYSHSALIPRYKIPLKNAKGHDIRNDVAREFGLQFENFGN